MINRLLLIFAATLALCLSACGGAKAPISASVTSQEMFGGVVHGVGGDRGTTFTAKRLVIQSLQDQVNIKSVVLNRGSCKGDEDEMSELPINLAFGKTAEFSTSTCDLIEAEITTDEGTWNFNFNGA